MKEISNDVKIYIPKELNQKLENLFKNFTKGDFHKIVFLVYILNKGKRKISLSEMRDYLGMNSQFRRMFNLLKENQIVKITENRKSDGANDVNFIELTNPFIPSKIKNGEYYIFNENNYKFISKFISDGYKLKFPSKLQKTKKEKSELELAVAEIRDLKTKLQLAEEKIKLLESNQLGIEISEKDEILIEEEVNDEPIEIEKTWSQNEIQSDYFILLDIIKSNNITSSDTIMMLVDNYADNLEQNKMLKKVLSQNGML